MHYYLVCLTILAVYAPPHRIDDVRSLDSSRSGAHTTKDDLLEHWALDICGIVFTSKIPTVIVNAFGPMAYCRFIATRTASTMNDADYVLGARHMRAQASRQELKRQLIACKPITGWPIQRLIDSLEDAWREERQSRRE